MTVEVPAPAPGVDGYCCGALTMEDQIEWVGLTGPIKGGDSGSALLSAGSEFQVVGLNWGSDGTYNYANNVDRVLAALNLSLNFVSCVQDCLYSAAAEAASGLEEWKTDEDDGLGLLDLGHRFRDQVLQESAVGRQLTQMYYQFSDEAVRDPAVQEALGVEVAGTAAKR